MRYAINDFSQVEGHGLSEVTLRYYSALTIGSTFSSHHLIHTIFVITDNTLRRAVLSHVKEGAGRYRTLIVDSLAEVREIIRQNRLDA